MTQDQLKPFPLPKGSLFKAPERLPSNHQPNNGPDIRKPLTKMAKPRLFQPSSLILPFEWGMQDPSRKDALHMSISAVTWAKTCSAQQDSMVLASWHRELNLRKGCKIGITLAGAFLGKKNTKPRGLLVPNLLVNVQP